MALKKKHFSKIELKNLHSEIENGEREMTQDELDTLIDMFYSRWGNAMFGMCLNPLFLLNEPFTQDPQELEEIEAWKINETLEDFGQEREIPDIDISFLCEDPQECPSYQANSIACRCIRERFSSPEAFAIWRRKQIEELGEKIKDLIPLH